MYTIGDVAKMFKLPISTIRYYHHQKLLLDLKRDSKGIRYFDEKDIEALRVIECLKKLKPEQFPKEIQKYYQESHK